MKVRHSFIYLLGLLLVTGCGSDSGPPPEEVGPDPLYLDQWHLKNSAQVAGLTAGEDVNAEGAWSQGYTGAGVVVVAVDDGLEANHEDLWRNLSFPYSRNYQYYPPAMGIPYPTNNEDHGTMVGGVIAARGSNSIGVSGVAPRASLAVYNLLWEGGTTESDIQDAMQSGAPVVAVSNNSWGADADGLGELGTVLSLWQQGVAYGAANGRGGKGTVYVWAAGNGAWVGPYSGVDNSNQDFQANNRHVMAVCAVDGHGVQSSYSEPGANLWLCAPGGDNSPGISTTDLAGARGNNPFYPGDYDNQNYTKTFQGTSASTPIVSGVVAMMLEANPSLTWRDVRLILAVTARKNQAADPGWLVTVPAGAEPAYHFNHKYGFGVVDAGAAVSRALNWANVAAQQTPLQGSNSGLGLSIPNDGTVVSNSIVISGPAGFIIEYVEVDVNITHPYQGDLEITVENAGGSVSTLVGTHPCLNASGGLLSGACATSYSSGWTFGSARHLGESPNQTWTLKVRDNNAANGVGTLNSWTLRIYGR